MLNPADIEALAAGHHADPFAVLGMHEHEGHLWVRAMLPGARAVKVVDAVTGRAVATLTGVNPAGIFEGPVLRRRKRFAYRLKINWMGAAEGNGDNAAMEIEDPYRFPAVLGDLDVWLLAEGKHARLYEKLGAHRVTLLGVEGVSFALWAPNARRVSVVGNFNYWDGRRHPMRLRRECGVWEIFIPGLKAGALYKYQLLNAAGKQLPLKADPFAFASELRPATGSIVTESIAAASSSNGQRLRGDGAHSGKRLLDTSAARDRPVSIYEVHAGSWRRGEGGRLLTWGEIGDQLLPYVRKLGFTHLEFLPVMEHPFDGSWGYQPTGLYAPTARHGTPGEFATLVQRCHNEGVGVLLDWVPGHFPGDAHALAQFDGTHLYDHADPRQGVHPDWNTLIYNFGRREVRNFLSANALYWLECFGVDGLRVDAVASMLYLDYSRPPGQWVPNARGGRENLDAVAFVRETNRLVAVEHPGAVVIAEESTTWPGVTRTVQNGGLGFHYKWNMGWMNDTLGYMRRDPVHRRHHHNALTFGLMYAFDETFVLPLSHDEVVHGKRSLVGKMPGDRWQRFANLRLYFGFMWAHPGKKLLFMGGEFGQEAEWNHDVQLDWNAIADPLHQGVQRLVADLNRAYRDLPALYQCDCEPRGFEWLDTGDRDQSVLAFLRRGRNDHQWVVAVCNFTPVPNLNYRVGVPKAGWYRELINTDSAWYGGSDLGNHGGVKAVATACHGRDYSLQLCLPPLACLMFVWGAQ